MCMCDVHVFACARVRVHVCMCACVRVCMCSRVCILFYFNFLVQMDVLGYWSKPQDGRGDVNGLTRGFGFVPLLGK